MPDNGNDKPITPLDKLLQGLGLMATKLDTIAARVDEMEQARAAPRVPPPAPPAVSKEDNMPVVAKVDDTDPDEKGDLPPTDVPGAPAPTAADSSLQAIRTRRAKLAAFQARADGVCALFGSSAPRPLEGESVNGYARRILRGWQPMSDSWKAVDLDTVSGPTLAIAADDIMRSASVEAANPKVPAGFLMERKRSDGGHTITEFFGQSRLWLEQAGARPRRFVTRINLNPSSGYSAH